MGDILTRRREILIAGSGKTIDDYVQNGLVFWLDGIENTRNGHNASSTTWQDLTSSHRDMTYHASSEIGDNYCILNDKCEITRLTATTTSYTIEVVAPYTSNSSVQMIMPWKGNAYGTVYFENGKIMFRSASSSTSITGIVMEQGINTYAARGNSNFRVNGRTATTGTLKRSATTAANWMGYYSSSYPFKLSTKIHAIRIYNRALSDAELMENYEVDAARFR